MEGRARASSRAAARFANGGGTRTVARTAAWMADSPKIATTHLTATTPNGETLAAVSYTNDRCAVLRDGEPVDGMEWPPGELHHCTEAFLRLAGLLK
jgi:sulfur carrier protein ThiS